MSARSTRRRNRFASARPGQVERDAEDVAPLLHPVGRRLALAVERFEPDADGAPSHVADAGTLDLDDLGAHLGGQRGAERFAIKVPLETILTPWSGPNASGTRVFSAITSLLRIAPSVKTESCRIESCAVCAKAGNPRAPPSLPGFAGRLPHPQAGLLYR